MSRSSFDPHDPSVWNEANKERLAELKRLDRSLNRETNDLVQSIRADLDPPYQRIRNQERLAEIKHEQRELGQEITPLLKARPLWKKSIGAVGELAFIALIIFGVSS